jgi:biopolymer transport protein ExbD
MRLKRPEGMNIIPFIDIMLVLLTIVLTVSTFITQRVIKLELPKAEQSTPLKSRVSHEILISQEGALLYEEQSMTLDALKSTLQTLSLEENIILRADTKSPFGVFISVVDMLKIFKFPHVEILVQKN